MVAALLSLLSVRDGKNFFTQYSVTRGYGYYFRYLIATYASVIGSIGFRGLYKRYMQPVTPGLYNIPKVNVCTFFTLPRDVYCIFTCS